MPQKKMEKLTTLNKIIIPKNKANKSQEILENLNSISQEDINTIEQEVIFKEENKEPVHDLERARKALYDTSETLEHYKNYEEALKIISESKEPLLFMQL